MGNWGLVKGWYVHEVGNGQVILCVHKTSEPGYYHTYPPSTPHYQKNGNFDRFWLISRLKQLRAEVSRGKRYNGMLGSTTPMGVVYVLAPTSVEFNFRLPQQGGFIGRKEQ